MRINDYLNDDELKEFKDLLLITGEFYRSGNGIEDLGWITERRRELEHLAYRRSLLDPKE